MKRILSLCLLAPVLAFSQPTLDSSLFGSNNAPYNQITNGYMVFPEIYHSPQYMPNYPTAAPIWARVVDVECEGDSCKKIDYLPEMGRAEYLFFRPIQKKQPVQCCVQKEPRIVFVEVPVKKKPE